MAIIENTNPTNTIFSIISHRSKYLRIIIAATICFIMLILADHSYASTNPHKSKMLHAQETYVELHPAEGYLHIIEYDLKPSVADKDRISKIVKTAKENISTANYSKIAFGFKSFMPMEEKLYKDKRGIIVGEYNLLSKEENLIKLLQDSFGRIFNRPIEVIIGKNTIEVTYDGSDIHIADNNALGVLAKDNKRKILWKNGINKYEFVFNTKKQLNDPSIYEIFGEDITSPVKSKKEIDQWKNK